MFVFLFLLLLNNETHTHPHMFIDVSYKIVISKDKFEGMHICWQFDDMNSTYLIEEFDKNKDFKFNKIERDSVYYNMFLNAKEYQFFANIKNGVTDIPITNVKYFSPKIINRSLLRYNFYIPLNIEINNDKAELISIFFKDPSMYIAFSANKKRVSINKPKDLSIKYYIENDVYLQKLNLVFTKK